MRIVLVIPCASPSQNVTDRQHWAKRHRQKRLWGAAILAAVGNSGNLARMKATGRRRLTIIRHGKRELDPANIVGGAKGIIDELVAHGLLIDDSPRWLASVTGENGSKAQGNNDERTILVLEDDEPTSARPGGP
jgi:hypothetical protein